MPISEYVKALRARVGHDLLLMPGVAALVRDARGRVLLQRRAEDDRWTLPSGAVDPGESPGEAVVREVREETGLDVVPERVAGVFGGRAFRTRYPNGDEAEFTVIVFECRAVGGRLGGQDGETAELRYVEPQEAASLLRARFPTALFHHASDLPDALFDGPGSSPPGA